MRRIDAGTEPLANYDGKISPVGIIAAGATYWMLGKIYEKLDITADT